MRFSMILLVGAMSALTVPAHAAPADDAPSATTTAGAPAIAPPPAGMGQIVFYRPSSMGALISCRVSEGQNVVNRLPPGKYFVHQTTPGVHEYSVKAEAKDVLRVDVEEGETHYARCAIQMGIIAGRPNLSPQTREDFDKRGKKLKLQEAYVAKGDKSDKEEPKS